MKVIIAGGRDFNDFDYLQRYIDYVQNNHKLIIDEIVSGCANGADKLGERYANKNEIKIKKFPANWKEFGKAAGHIRNKEMAEYADYLIAFWDGKSKGTKNMIDNMKKLNKDVIVVEY